MDFGIIAGIGIAIAGITSAIIGGVQNQQNIDYQNALNEKIMDREDTYMARRVRDFENAGFSPLAAASSTGAHTTTISAPQNGTGAIDGMNLLGSGLSGIMQNSTTRRGQDISYKSNRDTNATSQFIALLNSSDKGQEMFLEDQHFYDSLLQADKHFEAEQKNILMLNENNNATQKAIAKYRMKGDVFLEKLRIQANKQNLSTEIQAKVDAQIKEYQHAMQMLEQTNDSAEKRQWIQAGTFTLNNIIRILGAALVPASGIGGIYGYPEHNPIGFGK